MKYTEALGRLSQVSRVTLRQGYAVACCPAHNDKEPSLSIRRLPNGDAFFTCFAGCDYSAVVAAVCGFPVSQKTAPEAPEPRYDYQEYALELWDSSQSHLGGTPVERYLLNRGINLPLTNDLAYLPRAQHPSGGQWPAMIAAVKNADHDIIGIHRTFLTHKGDKAPVTPAKMMLGHCSGGAVRFMHRNATLQPTLFIAEGIETALSVKQLFGNIVIYAGLSVYGMRSVQVEPGVKNIVIVADGDEPDSIAFKAAQRAVAAFLDRGYKSYLLRCHRLGQDFNDVLLEKESIIPKVTE